MKRGRIFEVLVFAGLAAAFVCVWQLQVSIDRQKSQVQTEADELALRSPGVVKKLSLEYAPLMGAIYWTRVVQYYGEKHRMHQTNLDLLWPLLDITTTLDPKLIVAYRFGATFLSDAPPRGAGEPDKAVQLLQRGLQYNPEYWRFYQDLGNVYYFDKKDYVKAAQSFATGSKLPGAMPFMKIMAAKIAGEGQSIETSYELWNDILQTSTDDEIKKNAADHLRLLQAELDMKKLDQLSDEFLQKEGRRPTRIGELIQAGLLRGVPRDPLGFPYVLGESGKAELHLDSPLLEEWLTQPKK